MQPTCRAACPTIDVPAGPLPVGPLSCSFDTLVPNWSLRHARHTPGWYYYPACSLCSVASETVWQPSLHSSLLAAWTSRSQVQDVKPRGRVVDVVRPNMARSRGSNVSHTGRIAPNPCRTVDCLWILTNVRVFSRVSQILLRGSVKKLKPDDGLMMFAMVRTPLRPE